MFGQGNIMHCMIKCNISHNFVDKLQEGIVYSIKGFTVQPNKDEYWIIKGLRQHHLEKCCQG